MKVMKKTELINAYSNPGEDWRDVVLLEQTLMKSLHHPLIVNLCYSFQNPAYVVLVMDTCPGGDLAVFALTDERLSPEQVRFVGMAVAAVFAFLHERHVLYRDLAENLLLDASGHVRLIDFGLALAGDGQLPTSDELCGTPCYMAPEVAFAGRRGAKPYSAPADWYTLGVLLYELTEQRLPFGEEPRFHDHKAEWRKPKAMVNADGKKAADLESLVKGLLEWRPEKRLGGGKHANTPAASRDVKAHKYWRAPEWQLVETCRLPSPLLEYVSTKSQKKPHAQKLKKQQRAAIETAVRIANSDEKKTPAEGGTASSTAAHVRALDVDGWDFVSPHAIEQEYVENIAHSVAML